MDDETETIYECEDYTIFRQILCGDEFVEICNGKLHIRLCVKDNIVVVEQEG